MNKNMTVMDEHNCVFFKYLTKEMELTGVAPDNVSQQSVLGYKIWQGVPHFVIPCHILYPFCHILYP